MKRFMMAGAAACCGSFLLSVGLPAQDAGANHIDSGAKQMMGSGDKAFAMKAAQDGLAEVQLGKLAAEKGSDADVKSFAQQMVDDHTKANDQLKSLAQQENMTLPETIDSKDQATYDKLSKMSGAAFDKAYMTNMVKDHQMDVKEFQHESDKGQDANIKNFASQTLPILQSHLEHAKSVQSKTSGSSM